MSNEKFTQGEWYLGNPFQYENTRSEWRNVYADGEKNPIAVVLVNDGCGKAYHNDTLIAAAPEMYRVLSGICFEKSARICDYAPESCKVCSINKALMKARGEE